MSIARSSALSPSEKERYDKFGFHFPVQIFENTQARTLRDKFFEYREQNRSRLAAMPINQHYQVFSEMHFAAGWVYRIVTHPRILDAVQSILGENFLVWNTNWFAKMPGEKTFVSWHQDGMYWKLAPFKIITAWIALTP